MSATEAILKFYADSADVDRVVQVLRSGLVSGVTSNPTILDRSDRGATDFASMYETYVAAGATEVFFQTWGSDTAEMLANARRITELGDRVVVKLTATLRGFAAASQLHRAGVPTLITAVNTVAQAAVAAQVGADYVAPYFGQIGDRDGEPPVALIAAMQAALSSSPTQILLASIRNPRAVELTAALGVQLFTAHPDVIEACALSDHSATADTAFEALMLRRS
jgi:transaldolase